MDKIHKKVLVFGITFFSKMIKIFFQIPEGCCRFFPSCTEYSKEAVQNLPLPLASIFIIKRIMKCHPFHGGGFDPVIKGKKS